MLIRSLAYIFIVASSFIIVTGQVSDAQKTVADKPGKTPDTIATKKSRDIPFPNGVDLQFLIKELAHDLDLNVLFDPESFRTPGRKAYIELKNVTTAAALDYILLQEGLYFENVGPKTILVAHRAMGLWVREIGIGVNYLPKQLAQFFGVEGGILINTVRENSPSWRAGLKAGDVIVEADGLPVTGALGVVRAINDKKESDVILTIVRDRKRQMVSVTAEKRVESVLQKN